MNSFRTELKISQSIDKIDIKDRLLTTGSCFANAIGDRLARYKFSALVNPFGTNYNPVSIHKTMLYAINNQVPLDNTFITNNELYFNFDFHSEFSSLDKAELKHSIAEKIETVHYFLKTTSWLMITWGTAWVYERQDTNEIVANCHKLPAKKFLKRLLKETEILASFAAMHSTLKALNPNVKIILTVSPVRHIKDTIELNSVSKSILRASCHAICELYTAVEYFPSFEIMMDDLRDYRFYKSDMIHPTEDAEEYIWSKFSERYFTKSTTDFIRQWHSILQALHHKPFHPQATAHQQFLKDAIKKLEAMQHITDITDELNIIKQQLV